MKRINNCVFYILIFTLTFWCMFSCTKYPDPAAVFENYEQGKDTNIVRKVLVVCWEGATSQAVQELKLPQISSLLNNSVYTFEGLSEPNTNDASTWASIATGVRTTKHQMDDESFIANASETGSVPVFYPTFFYRVREGMPASQTLSVSSWSALNENLLVDANERISTLNDLQTKDSVVAHLKDGNENVISVDFRDQLKAGIEGGFSADNDKYVSALKNCDSYLGELLKTIKERENYSHEQWLIVLTSNHGAIDSSYGGTSLTERKIFTLFYSPTMVGKELSSNIINSVHFKGDASTIGGGAAATTLDSKGLFYATGNKEKNNAITIEFKARFNKNKSGNYDYNWTNFMHLGLDGNSDNGWGFYKDHSSVSIWVQDPTGHTQLDGPRSSFQDDKWHSIAATISYKDGSRTVNYYEDAVLMDTETVPDTSTFLMPQNVPLGVGYRSGAYVDVNIADIRIWNKELSLAALYQHSCSMIIDENDPDRQNLVGYWPAQDGNDTFLSGIEGGADFNLSGVYSYDITPNTLPCVVTDQFLVENVTIAHEIYLWLGITEQASWQLDGESYPLSIK